MYYQLKTDLRQRILDGELAPGQQIASENQLAKDYRVSRMTVRQGLSELENEGMLERRPGVGTFVAQPKIQRKLVGEFVTFFESELGGRRPTSRVLTAQRVTAEGKPQVALRLRHGEPVVRLERLLLLDSEPVTFSTIYVPEGKCPDLLEDAQQWQSLIWLFERKYHLHLAKVEQRVDAVSCDARLSQLLGVSAGSPMIHIERTTYLEGGEPIEFVDSYLSSDKYSYNITLYRREGESRPDGPFGHDLSSRD